MILHKAQLLAVCSSLVPYKIRGVVEGEQFCIKKEREEIKKERTIELWSEENN